LRLTHLIASGLERRILHCFLMRGAEPSAFVLGQVLKTGAALSPALILKLAKRPLRLNGRRLRKKIGPKLRDTREGGNEQEIQFQFHLLIL